MKAFLPGAGLGTRLRPLTSHLPKPLVPVFNRPMIEHALDACIAAGASAFAINTHHCPEAWEQAFPAHAYRGAPIDFFFEPLLLETGGGLKNIERWVDDDTLLVYNGDIFATLDLQDLLARHRDSGAAATLALRSEGPARVVEFDAPTGRIIDLHGRLGRGPGSHQFTGIYCVEARFLDLIPPGEVISAREAMLHCAKNGELAGVCLDDGQWVDLGTVDTYLEAHLQSEIHDRCHPTAHIDPTARVSPGNWLGPGSSVGADCVLDDCIVWPGCQVPAGTKARREIFHTHHNSP